MLNFEMIPSSQRARFGSFGQLPSAIETTLMTSQNKKGEDSNCASPFYDGKYHPPKYKQLGCFVNVILR
jgi:hypothetical protein